MDPNHRITRIKHLLLALMTLSLSHLPDIQGADQATPPTGFKALFNGKDLEGWHGMGHFDPRKLWSMSDQERQAKREKEMEDVRAHWSVEDGELVNDGHGVYLTTDQDYGNMEFLIDYKTVAQADSGIYLRGNPQVQIWDYTKEGGKWNIDADKGSGGLWNNSPGAPGKNPMVLADRPFGEWNSFRIIQVKDYTTVFLNDQLVVDHAKMENFWDRSNPLWAKGPIQLQTHGGEIRWRNLFIREIPDQEVDQMLSEPGFKPVFNGHNLDGWQGPVANYEVKEGAIVCKPNNGGTIYYHQNLSDFVVRLEFKLPAGGNNGLAIRYPGSGDTAYQGMCELQVLDDSAEKYAKLDQRQYHGSAYGMVAAKRGHQKPVGQWNEQEVTVVGSTIKVVLNGTTILDTDLRTVNQYMAN
ncbi:MAG: 3-keto-disaccharide hydrolase, partial [Limisphaerales bacterium]